MSKQDRIHSRTPVDAENKLLSNLGKSSAEIRGLSSAIAKIEREVADKGATIKLFVDSGIVGEGGNVQASVIIEAINNESSAQIKAKNILFEGEKLDIKVDDTNIEGKLTADVLDIDNIIAENVNVTGTINAEDGVIGGWHLGLFPIPTGANSEDDVTDEKSLRSPNLSGTKLDKDGVERIITYRAYLTAKGVYICGQYDTAEVSGDTYFNHTTWLELLEGLQRIENLEKRLDAIEQKNSGG